jgi:hypothetical protein
MTKDQAKRIINALLGNLEGRNGFDIINVIRDDPQVYNEMYASLVEDTIQAAESSDDPSKSRFHP